MRNEDQNDLNYPDPIYTDSSEDSQVVDDPMDMSDSVVPGVQGVGNLEDLGELPEEEWEEPAPPPPPRPQPQPQEDQDRKYGNPHARARIAERDARIAQQRFQALWNAMQQAALQPDEEEVEEQAPDFDSDPLQYLRHKLDETTTKLQQQQLREQMEKQQQVLSQSLQAGAQDIRTFAAESNGVYPEAMQHISNVRIADLLSQNPQLTYQEANQLLARDAARKIVMWQSQGLSPAEQFMDEAIRLGYDFESALARHGFLEQQQQRVPQTAKQTIQREVKRENKTRTVGNLGGKPVKKRITANDALSMEEDDFDDVLDALANEKGSGIKSNLKMSDFFNVMR